MARRKRKVEEQMDMLEEGGLLDEGGSIDPVSGNDVPPGSTQEEVRDDIPAQLSEGEFVFPADVVRYIGLEKLMELRQKAKAGLQKMEEMGQMGNSEEATMSDDVEFNAEVDDMIDNLELAEGGMVPQSVPPVAPPVSLQPPTAMNRTYAMGGQVMSVEQEMMQKQGRNYAQGGAVMSVEQEMMQKSGRRGYAQGGAVMSVEQEMMQKNNGYAIGGLQGQNPLMSSQTTPVYQAPAQLPTYASLVQQPARQAAQAVQPEIEQKEYIGPNGERITIQFVNGNPATPIPEGYKPFDPTAEPVTPEIAKPEVAPGPEGEERKTEKPGIKDIGMKLAGKGAYKTDKAYQKAVDDLMSFEGKLFGTGVLGVVAGVPTLGMGAMKSKEGAYQEKIDSYYKEVARIAAEREPDRFTEEGLYSRLTNTKVPVVDIADKDTLRGFTDESKNTYVDSDGLVRDTSGLSDEAKEGLGIASSKEEQDRYTGDDVASGDFDGDGTVSDDMFGD